MGCGEVGTSILGMGVFRYRTTNDLTSNIRFFFTHSFVFKGRLISRNYLGEIKKAFENLKLENKPELLCEPGRALVAESGSSIVKVVLRKKQKLYINDGTYGSLFDAGVLNFILPTRMIPNGRMTSKKLTAYSLYGPTCDSADFMKGPFVLPNNLKEGDYIEIGQLGAYSLTFRTKFNGFYSDQIFEVQDKPIMSMYEKDLSSSYLVA